MLEQIATQIEAILKGKNAQLQRGSIHLMFVNNEWEVYQLDANQPTKKILLSTPDLLTALLRFYAECLPY